MIKKVIFDLCSNLVWSNISIGRKSCKIDQKSYAFLEITNILGPKTFIGFASINLYLIESEFYERYFEGLFKNWMETEVEEILNRSFSSLLFCYWVRRLWLERSEGKGITDRLAALKGFLDNVWSVTTYASLFYETFVLFDQQLPDLVDYFNEGGMKMKSFVDTMPEAARKMYDEFLVAPAVKKVELEKNLELEQERAHRERVERELERAEREWERERVERELERVERERAEKELKMTCIQAVVNKFPEISAKALVTINQLTFSQCNKLLLELGVISDVHSCELFLKNLL